MVNHHTKRVNVGCIMYLERMESYLMKYFSAVAALYLKIYHFGMMFLSLLDAICVNLQAKRNEYY